MEPGVANREGKGAIKRRRMRKVILQNSGNPPDADHKVVVGRGPKGCRRDRRGRGGTRYLYSCVCRLVTWTKEDF